MLKDINRKLLKIITFWACPLLINYAEKNKKLRKLRSSLMKKTIALLTILTNFLFTSGSFAGEIFGYPVAPTQVRFYILILGLIGVSVTMVSAAYLSFWVMDLKKKREKVRELIIIKKQPFAGELVAAAQPAK